MDSWALLFPQISPEPCFWEKTGVGPWYFIHERDGKEVAMGLRRTTGAGFPSDLPEPRCVTLGESLFLSKP